MAQESPSSIDIQDIQFKVHHRSLNIFPASDDLRSNINLLAVASNQGMLFAGNPNAPEFKVILLQNLVEAKTTGHRVIARQVQLPHEPNVIGVSADGSMLAVSYLLNKSVFLNIYSVLSFTTPNIKLLYNLRLSPEEDVSVLQLLWNPVLTNNLAIVLNNGALAMYTLKDGNDGNFVLNTLDKRQQVRCGCWSPKGKQLVLGFPNGKLQQFKPDLTPARTIECSPGILPGPFDTIAIHWLSTFQFVVAFLQNGDEQSPLVYIVNAPKGSAPNYINYYDVCYSGSGPRQHQISFTHIQAWNLLLVTSANGVEVGVLGTKGESGDTPTWLQYVLLDEARIEMPLTENKDDTYPIGFAFNTAATHQLTVAEQLLPPMPMIHVLSTHGHLVSFNFLNLATKDTSLCSPPPPITMDASLDQFRPLDEFLKPSSEKASSSKPVHSNEMSFASFNPSAVSSTPAMVKEKPQQSFFSGIATTGGNNFFGQSSGTAFVVPKSTNNSKGANAPPSNLSANAQFGTSASTSSSAGATTTATGLSTSNIFTGLSTAKAVGFGGLAKATDQLNSNFSSQSSGQNSLVDISKPLYVVPPTFTPPAPVLTVPEQQQTLKTEIAGNEVDDVVKRMITVQINSFNLELQQISQQPENALLANIGKPDEMRSYTKRLYDLQEIIDQAVDRDFEKDVQQLRYLLNESYAMLTECRTKLDMYNNPDITRLTSISTFDPTNRRQLAKLHSSVATNRAHLQQLQQQVDAQWEFYQDLVRQNSRTKIHIPCLEGIYQRMSKLKDLMACQRTKLNLIKTKLKQKGLISKPFNELDSKVVEAKPECTMESLTDSILSMSLSHVVDETRAKLSNDKLNVIRNLLQNRQIVHIKPRRPDRIGLKSEVIFETKLRNERRAREGAVTQLRKMQQEMIPIQSTSVSIITKPTATRPVSSDLGSGCTTPSTIISFIPTTPTAATPNFAFGGTSMFVKTVSASSVGGGGEAAIKAEQPLSDKDGTATTFTGSMKTINKTETSNVTSTATNQQQHLTQAPISFAAKVVSTEATTHVSTKPADASVPPSKDKPQLETDIPKTFSFGSGAHDRFVTHFGGGEGDAKPTFNALSPAATNAGNDSLFAGINTSKPVGPAFETSFNFSGLGSSIGTSLNKTVSSAPATTTSSNKPFSFGGFSTEVGTDASTIAKGNTSVTTNMTITTIAATTTTTTKAGLLFSGLGKPVGGETINECSGPVTTTATNSDPSGTSSTKATTGSNVAVSLSNATAKLGENRATDSLLYTLNICKPTSKESGNASSGNVFGGSSSFSFVAPGGTAKPIFGGDNVGSSTFSFGLNTSSSGSSSASATTTVPATPPSPSPSPTPTPLTATTTTIPQTGGPTSSSTASSSIKSDVLTSTTNVLTSTTNVLSSFSLASSKTSALEISSATVTSVTNATASSSTAFTFGKPTSSNTTTAVVSSPATSSSTPFTTVFGKTTDGTSTPLSAVVASTVATTTTVVPSPSLFGAQTTKTTTVASLFSSSTPTIATSGGSSANIFGGILKPEQSVFGSPTAPQSGAGGSGLFATAAAANPLPFGNLGAGSGSSSIFGGSASSGFGTTSSNASSGSGSIFGGGGGGGAAAPSSPFGAPAVGGSVFSAAKPTEDSTNIFGSPKQATTAAVAAGSGGSIFGQNSFGQTTGGTQSSGSIFGGGSSQQKSTSPFGASSSIFGGRTAGGTPTGSIFGGASTTAFGQNSASGFGSFSQPSTAFGSSTGGSGSFAQGGASVAQSGFGSPQQTSPFSQPVFGGPATFGSPPAFGAQPSFGGAPSFGSPKGFGSFAAAAGAGAASPTAAAATSTFSSPTQKSNLFEALGSTETGLSFGNLAQNTNTNPAKPTFGGSSFMNYRA